MIRAYVVRVVGNQSGHTRIETLFLPSGTSRYPLLLMGLYEATHGGTHREGATYSTNHAKDPSMLRGMCHAPVAVSTSSHK